MLRPELRCSKLKAQGRTRNVGTQKSERMQFAECSELIGVPSQGPSRPSKSEESECMCVRVGDLARNARMFVVM